MGSIQPKTGKKGTTYLAQANVTIKRITHRANKTFERRPDAARWLREMEATIRANGGLTKTPKSQKTIGDLIDRYVALMGANMGRSKGYSLAATRREPFADILCNEFVSSDLVDWIEAKRAAGNAPSTAMNHLSHLSHVFSMAKGLNFPLDFAEFEDARRTAKGIKMVTPSAKRKRIASVDELDRILTYFSERSARTSYPMVKLIVFALFATRRESEITRLRWEDIRRGDGTKEAAIIVNDAKSPNGSSNNNIKVHLPPEALRVIDSMPKVDERIFPFDGKTAGTYWRNACKRLDIEDLHFHDLRHTGITRRWEMGATQGEVMDLSGHQSLSSLKRYMHYDQTGDKFKNWEWQKYLTV